MPATNPSTNIDAVDISSIWLTRLLLLSLPLMFLNPMNPSFHRLQLTELIALPTFALVGWRSVMRKERFGALNPLVMALGIFLLVLYLGSFVGQAPRQSFLEATKFLYLALLAIVIYINGQRYAMGDELRDWACMAYLLILAGGILGALLLLLGIRTGLAEPTRIIGIALGIEQWLPVTPRVTSLLKPTANMTAAYLALYTLPALNHLFQHYIPPRRGGMRIALLAVIMIISLLTMSRAFIGVLLAIWLGLAFLDWQIPARRLSMWSVALVAAAGWLLLVVFTIFYPLHIDLSYSNDPSFTKEIVNLGNKQVPNPVYFLRPNIGAEHVTLSISYAFNHYAWLKYAGWKMLELQPWLGMGIGSFSAAVEHLAKAGVVPGDLAGYRSAQSQYFTLFGEVGLLGCVVLTVVLATLVRALKVRARDKQDRVLLLCLPVAALIAVDLDILSFRWLWGLVAMGLVTQGVTNSYSLIKKGVTE